ncbi:MAG: hypothetical protein EOR57_06055 [Mesorhizobium sp.]|uniref:hypothetical protein n=1 Tax=Mesorhizobium sp. TaxID=1871066 RepID=UPI000FE930DC|nr:hypothetical protein [Mesorhizobium sp.]RWL21993.1 MAG: hypothetical protein EOR57_06055 [Mesorhizobium sp.]
MLDEDADMPNASQKIAENVLLLAVARVSMAFSLPLIGFVSWLGGQYLESKFDVINDRVTTVEQRASSASNQVTVVNDRLIAVETTQTQDSASNEKFQGATLTRLDRVQDSIVGLSNAVAALTATLQAVAEERNRSPPPR